MTYYSKPAEKPKTRNPKKKSQIFKGKISRPRENRLMKNILFN